MRLLCYTESHLKCAQQLTRCMYNNNNNNSSSRGNVSTDSKNNNGIDIEYENEQKMIKLKDISAKLHKYFSKTFGVVKLNVEHTHTHSHAHMYMQRKSMSINCTGMDASKNIPCV